MELTFEPIVTLVRYLQPLKAEEPTVVTPPRIVKVFRAVQLMKSPSPILVRSVENLTPVSCSQLLKTLLPRVRTVSGIVIVSSPLFANA